MRRLLVLIAFVACSQAIPADAANIFVRRTDSLKDKLSNVNPGDTITLQNGLHTIPGDGIAQLRRSNGGGVWGWTGSVTTIRPQTPGRVTVDGNLDIYGSFIRIEGLKIRGSVNNDAPGIACYTSHNIDIENNTVWRCGGGGINFNQSDVIRIVGNTTFRNGYRNIDQHSGISVYQPIDHAANPRGAYWRVYIARNNSYINRNDVPGPFGLTDGNGIITDDYKYEQTQYLNSYHYQLINNAGGGPYNGLTLIEGNLCTYNGGSGIQCFLSVNISVKNNTCIGNRRKAYYSDGNGNNTNGGYANLGQISIQDSDDCYIINNVMQSRYVNAAPGDSPYAASESGNSSGNVWDHNLLDSTVNYNGLWNNYNIDTPTNTVYYQNPNFVDEANYDYTAQSGYDLGISWGNGHFYTDLYGTVVGPGQRTDLGAIQN